MENSTHEAAQDPRPCNVAPHGPASAGRGALLPLLALGAALLLTFDSSPSAAQGERTDRPQLSAELEAGAVWQSKNDVQIPNDDSGTRFSLVDLVGPVAKGAGRLTVRWSPADRHEVHGLLAPLTLQELGTPESELRFAGSTFEAGREVEATYRFNSWRAGYRYRIVSGARGDVWIGFTGKIRDAEVRIEQDGRSAKDTDVGFVPLLHLAAERLWAPTWSTSVELEGLAGGPGRAIDGAVKLRYGPLDGAGVSLGYRALEGGADVDAVYNFAWLQYVVLSIDVPLR